MRYEVDLVLGPCQYIGSKYFNQLYVPLFLHYIPIRSYESRDTRECFNLHRHNKKIQWIFSARSPWNGPFVTKYLGHCRAEQM